MLTSFEDIRFPRFKCQPINQYFLYVVSVIDTLINALALKTILNKLTTCIRVSTQRTNMSHYDQRIYGAVFLLNRSSDVV